MKKRIIKRRLVTLTCHEEMCQIKFSAMVATCPPKFCPSCMEFRSRKGRNEYYKAYMAGYRAGRRDAKLEGMAACQRAGLAGLGQGEGDRGTKGEGGGGRGQPTACQPRGWKQGGMVASQKGPRAGRGWQGGA